MSDQPARFTGAINFSSRRVTSVSDDRWNDLTLAELLSSLLHAQAYETTAPDRSPAADVFSRRFQWAADGFTFVNADIDSLYDELHAELARLDASAAS